MTFTLATVNVNGLRAAARKGMGDWLAETSADVITLQEVRAPEELLADLVGEDWSIVGGRPSSSRVVQVSRSPPAPRWRGSIWAARAAGCPAWTRTRTPDAGSRPTSRTRSATAPR